MRHHRELPRLRRCRTIPVAIVLATVLAACSSSSDDGTASRGDRSTTSAPSNRATCPATVDADQFASAKELRDLLATFNGFGLRSPGSDQHQASLDWLAGELAKVPEMEVEWEEFTIDRWQPTPDAPGDTPGRDLAAAGELAVIAGGAAEHAVPVIGAVPFSLPTTDDGVSAPLVYVPPDQEITAANAAGKVVIREIPHSSIPYAAFDVIGHFLTDDLPREGDYDRPYLRDLDAILSQAGSAGAVGLVMVWDAPTDQLRGYWDPHTGTRFEVPAVYAGSDQLAALRAAAERGSRARLAVHATWDRVPTRNLIATLRGQSRERIVVNTNTDSVTWVQENGNVAAIALARYLGSLPLRCRARDVQFALTSNHLGFLQDGTIAYSEQLDRDFDAGTVAFVMSPEHLGSREILPGADGRLAFTGKGDTFAWSAPAESPVLVKASIDAVKRRKLDRTAVLQGVGVPVDGQVPQICSQGGLGTVFHSHLIPTVAGISGPWSLWAPAFGEDAIDFDRMRLQAMAFGDLAVSLDDMPRAEIAGEYPAERQRRTEGAATCPQG